MSHILVIVHYSALYIKYCAEINQFVLLFIRLLLLEIILEKGFISFSENGHLDRGDASSLNETVI